MPLPFVHHNAPIYLAGLARPGPTERDNRAVHAFARLALHGRIDHVQCSWVKLGDELAADVLRGGADDMGGTLMEETISRMAGLGERLGAHGGRADGDRRRRRPPGPPAHHHVPGAGRAAGAGRRGAAPPAPADPRLTPACPLPEFPASRVEPRLASVADAQSMVVFLVTGRQDFLVAFGAHPGLAHRMLVAGTVAAVWWRSGCPLR